MVHTVRNHTYENWSLDFVYVYPDGSVFFSPDGIGRVFYDSIGECSFETGLEAVMHLSYVSPDDDYNL